MYSPEEVALLLKELSPNRFYTMASYITIICDALPITGPNIITALTMPLESIPLYVNSPHYEVRVIVKWRCGIGK